MNETKTTRIEAGLYKVATPAGTFTIHMAGHASLAWWNLFRGEDRVQANFVRECKTKAEALKIIRRIAA